MKSDVFISYASEDREDVAAPLAELLREADLYVWYDQSELTVGDKLHKKIGEGLANSTFGIVILSESYSKKGWTQNELSALLANEVDKGKLILPVRHQLTQQEVQERWPMLADRMTISTSEGMRVVSEELIKAMHQTKEIEADQNYDSNNTEIGKTGSKIGHLTQVEKQSDKLHLPQKVEKWCLNSSGDLEVARSLVEEALESDDNVSLQRLLANGCTPNPRDDYGVTPLHLACEKGNLDAVKLLIQYDADVDFPDTRSDTPLVWALREKYVHISLQLVDAGADVRSKYKGLFGMTPLHKAAELGDLNLVKLMLRKGAEVDATNYDFGTPIIVAVKNHNFEVVQELIRNGAELNNCIMTPRKVTPLHTAAEEGFLDIVELLIDAGAKVDTEMYCSSSQFGGNTQLFLAALRGHTAICELLLQHGADVNAKCNEGFRPAHVAAIHGHLETLKTLKNHGADLSAKSVWGKTAEDMAKEYRKRNIVRFLSKLSPST